MKKRVLIYIGVLLLLLAAVTAFRMRPAEPENSVLYERYKDMPGVRVGFIQDFPLNDSTTCDVTVFEALTDEGWERMVEEFNLMPLIRVQEIMDSVSSANNKPLKDTGNAVLYRKTPRFHPEQYGPEVARALGDTADAVFVSPYYRWMADFHCVKEQQSGEVIGYYLARLSEYRMTSPTGNTAAEATQ